MTLKEEMEDISRLKKTMEKAKRRQSSRENQQNMREEALESREEAFLLSVSKEGTAHISTFLSSVTI